MLHLLITLLILGTVNADDRAFSVERSAAECTSACPSGLLAAGQPPQSAPCLESDETGDEGKPGRGQGRFRDRPHRHPRRHGRGLGLRRLFYPIRADHRPLEEGEEERLLEFSRERFPTAFRLLTRVRRANPERYRAAFDEMVPRLRHLQRIYEESPELGAIIAEHAQNTFRIQRLARVTQRSRVGASRRARATRILRELVGANVELEARALEQKAVELEAHREEQIEARMRLLLDDQAERAAQRPRLRRAAEAVLEANDPQVRGKAEAELRELVNGRLEREIAALQQRAARARDHLEEETDRRTERIVEGKGLHWKGPGHRQKHRDSQEREKP